MEQCRARAVASWQAHRTSPWHHKERPSRVLTPPAGSGGAVSSLSNNRAISKDRREVASNLGLPPPCGCLGLAQNYASIKMTRLAMPQRVEPVNLTSRRGARGLK